MKLVLFCSLLLVALAMCQVSEAQVVHQVYYPATVAAAPVNYTQTTVYRPLLRPFSPVVTTVQQPVYAAPQPVVVARPTVPMQVVTPVPTVTRVRYRPILGGTVIRSW